MISFVRLASIKKEELIGKNHRLLNSGLHSKEYFKSMYRTIGTGHIWKGEFRNKKRTDLIIGYIQRLFPS
jgi:two-component system, NarL family, sensor histidine kinase NreB